MVPFVLTHSQMHVSLSRTPHSKWWPFQKTTPPLKNNMAPNVLMDVSFSRPPPKKKEEEKRLRFFFNFLLAQEKVFPQEEDEPPKREALLLALRVFTHLKLGGK